MTQPDEFIPSGAANYDSFAGFAATTQADWETQINGSWMNSLSPFSGICALFSQIPFLDGLATLGGYPASGNLTASSLNGFQIITNLFGDLNFGDPAAFMTSVFASLLDLVKEITELPTVIIDGIISWMAEIPDFLISLFNTFISTITVIPEMATSIINSIIELTAIVPDFITQLVNAILLAPDMITSMVNMVIGLISDDTSGGIATTLVNGVIGWMTAIPELITSFVEAFLAWVTSTPALIESVINAFISWVASTPALITSLVNAFLDWVAAVPELAGALLSAFITLMSQAPSIAVQLTESITSAIIDAIMTAVEGIPIIGGTIAQMLSSLTGFVGSTTDTSNNLSALSLSLFTDPPAVIGNIANVIVDAFDSTLGSLLNGIFAGLSPTNTAAGAAGGTGGGLMYPPNISGAPGLSGTGVPYVYSVVTAANYGVAQLGGASGAMGAEWHSTTRNVYPTFMGW